MLLDSLGSGGIEKVSSDLLELEDPEDLVEETVVLVDHCRVTVSHFAKEVEGDRHRLAGRRPQARNRSRLGK